MTLGGRSGGWILASFGGLAVRGAEVAAKLSLYMLAARLLDDQQCGALFLGMSWGMLAATASRLGIEKALSRLLAAELAVGQGRAARRVLVKGHLVVLAAGVAAGAATFAAAPFAAASLFHAATVSSLRAAGILVPCLAIAVTLSFALVGFGRTVLSQILQNLSWPIGMLAALGLGARQAGDLLLVMAGTQLAAALVALAVFRYERARLQDDRPLAQGAEPLPDLRRTAGPLYVVELVQVSINALPVLFLGCFADARDVALFSVANRASMLVLVVILSLSLTAAPHFASLHRRGQVAELALMARRTQLAGLAVGGPICLCLALLAGTLLGLINSEYTAGRSVLVILAAGQFVNALYTGLDSLLAMTGHGAVLRVLNLTQLLAMIVLGLVLIPGFGSLGAAIVAAIVTAQGSVCSAAVIAVYLPGVAPRMAPPLPDYVRHLLVRATA